MVKLYDCAIGPDQALDPAAREVDYLAALWSVWLFSFQLIVSFPGRSLFSL